MLAGFLLAGITHVLVPAGLVSRHLGSASAGAVVKASLLGIPLPLCSCSVIPMASSMRRQGASKGAVAGFLISTPETGVDSIALSYALLGPVLAVLRPIAAFVTAVTAGSLITWFDAPGAPRSPDESPDSGDGGQCCHASSAERESPGQHGFSGRHRLLGALRYGLVDMFADLSHWLFAGFALAGLAAAAIPQGWIEDHLGSGPWTMILMLLVGLPTYVCATSSTPVAAALIARGLSPGAALVFLLAGPATNMATMAVVARDLGRRSLILYLLSIAVVAVAFGLATDGLLDAAFQPAESPHAGGVHSAMSIVSVPCAVALMLLMLNGLRRRFLSAKAVEKV